MLMTILQGTKEVLHNTRISCSTHAGISADQSIQAVSCCGARERHPQEEAEPGSHRRGRCKH